MLKLDLYPSKKPFNPRCETPSPPPSFFGPVNVTICSGDKTETVLVPEEGSFKFKGLVIAPLCWNLHGIFRVEITKPKNNNDGNGYRVRRTDGTGVVTLVADPFSDPMGNTFRQGSFNVHPDDHIEIKRFDLKTGREIEEFFVSVSEY